MSFGVVSGVGRRIGVLDGVVIGEKGGQFGVNLGCEFGVNFMALNSADVPLTNCRLTHSCGVPL